MARLIGPDSGDRLTVRPGGSGYARSAEVVVYAASSGTTLANILTEAGAAISGSTLTTDDFGLIPLFQFPDGVDTVYVEVAGGPRTAVYARYDDRVDGLVARVTTLEAGGTAQPLNANLTTIAALDSGTAGALVTDGSGWFRKTYSQLKTAIGLGNVDNTADTAKPISTATQSALDLKLSIAAASGAYAPLSSASSMPRNTQTGTTYTLVAGDAGKVVRCTNAGAVTVTVPPNSSVPFGTDPDTIINVYALGAGGTTIAPGAGVTIRNNTSGLSQYGECSLRKDGTDEWVRLG